MGRRQHGMWPGTGNIPACTTSLHGVAKEAQPGVGLLRVAVSTACGQGGGNIPAIGAPMIWLRTEADPAATLCTTRVQCPQGAVEKLACQRATHATQRRGGSLSKPAIAQATSASTAHGTARAA